jgi:chromosome segregation ATPase
LNLNYDKIRSKVEHGGNHWTSYSDLFLVLSVVFLLLFVVANLRSGTMSFSSHSQMQAAKLELEDLRRQIKAYEVLKEDYLKQQASQEDISMYQELMGKLTLLEEDAKNERKQLFKAAKDAQEKEQALNRYQAMVKNIVNANLVSKSRVKKRDDIITAQDRDIDDLNKTVQDKESVIATNNQKIEQIETELEKQINEVKYAYRSKKRSQEKMQAAIAAIQADGEKRLTGLREQNSKYISQLEQAKDEIEEKNREKERLLATLNSKEQQFKSTVAELDKAHHEAVAREKKAYDQGLQREAEYQEAIRKKGEAYQARLKALNDEMNKTRGTIKEIEGQYQAAMGSLKATNETLEKNLKASNAKLNEQRMLAKKIKDGFARAGLNADVDLGTGDVTINFADEYFETGSSNLKGKMRDILEKTIPVYAKSLLENPTFSKKISNVEIVGFASPTFKGKFVNPDSLSQDDRQAVNYNMDLSYQRAKAIFEHVFDTAKMQFPHQKSLLPLVKVSGRSYLATDRAPAGSNLSDEQYCRQFDCKKSQRVIIRFSLKEGQGE